MTLDLRFSHPEADYRNEILRLRAERDRYKAESERLEAYCNELKDALRPAKRATRKRR